MREADLYAPMIAGAAEDGWVLFHPQEGSAKAPFDLCGVAPHVLILRMRKFGIGVAAEVKLVDKLPGRGKPLPWRLFATHQRTWLEAFAGAGGAAFAVLTERGDPFRTIVYVLRPGQFDISVNVMHSTELKFEHKPDRLVGWRDAILLWASEGPDITISRPDPQAKEGQD